jgi:bzd-type benzoyl-CoA reductase N subunit
MRTRESEPSPERRDGLLAPFFEATESLVNSHVERWVDEGGGVVGFFCSAMPEELVTAAGLLPFRVSGRGSTSTELADIFFAPLNCSFPRHCFNLALDGKYDFLDALVLFNSCDALRRTYDHWIRQIQTAFVRILHLPRKGDPPQVEFFRQELCTLRDELEKHFDVEITDRKLYDAIRLHNGTRRLLRQLYELRKADAPPISGAETLAVTVASTAMPKRRFNELLARLLAGLSDRRGLDGHRARLMIMGSELDDPAYLEIIEEQGGLVVTDSLCYGSRLFWADVEEDAEDPVAALARYYVATRPSCPRMCTQYEARLEYVTRMLDEFDVDGVILARIKFCDTWGFEGYSLTHDLKGREVPLLILEKEYNDNAVGQLRTRVQAFLELLEG